MRSLEFKNSILTLGFILGMLSLGATIFEVTNTNNAGVGSLRTAISNANSNAGPDTITFNISGAAFHTISLTSALPNITDQVFIDGYSQPGTFKNNENYEFNGYLRIGVDGNGLGFPGLILENGSSNSIITGLNLFDFNSASIEIRIGSNNNRIGGNLIGTNSSGTAAQGSGNQIRIYSNYNNIGYWENEYKNIISGCPSNAAVLFSGVGSYSNGIISNFIGVSTNGSSTIGGILEGVRFENGAYSNWIGNTWEGQMNRISGAVGAGIVVTGATTTGIEISGNMIYNCGGLPIDLNDDGLTANDSGDGDNGPNQLINFPTILRAITDDDRSIYAEVEWEGIAGHEYRLNWYEVGTSNGDNHGDVVRWLGRVSIDATTTGLNREVVSFGRSRDIPATSEITATIMDFNHYSTSELAENFPLTFGELKVTNDNDNINGDISSVLDLIDNPGADGISLREAITAGNNQEVSWGDNHIIFDIPGSGPHTIFPLTALPPITEQTYIDGWSEPNWSGGLPSVVIDGSSAGAGSVIGLEIKSQYCEVSAISIVNFSGDGIFSDDKNYGRLYAMMIGVLSDGVTPAGNGGYGVNLVDCEDWNIGYATYDVSVISDNALGGIRISGTDSEDAQIAGCHIGVNFDGTAALGSQPYGVILEGGARVNRIGGYGGSQSNVISGNTLDGILIQNSGTDYNKVLQCTIGLGANGETEIPNGRNGIRIIDGVISTKVGEPNFGNVISANSSAGIFLQGTGTSLNEIKGNIIGLNALGTVSKGNVENGIEIVEAIETEIGDTGSNQHNVISGNGQNGILIWSPSCTNCNNRIVGNIIGLNATGTADLGNGVDGVSLVDSHGNFVGGITSDHRNIISGNGGGGINLSESSSDNNTIQGNYIGTDITGTIDLGNDLDGISLYSGPQDNLVGGSVAGSRNIISGNGGDGIQIASAGNTTDGNLIQGNYIGVDVNGDPLGNFYYGIYFLQNISGNTIGGVSGEGNVISSNGLSGIKINSSCNNVNVYGNIIGLDPSGSIDRGNSGDGVEIEGGGHRIGGSTSGQGNTISGNSDSGIRIQGFFNSILGNYIGTTSDGLLAIPNDDNGIDVSGQNNNIGGSSSGESNLISGNGLHGIFLGYASSTGNEVYGNLIGTDISGNNPIGNSRSGIRIDQGSNNHVGNHQSGRRNIIGGNAYNGVELSGNSAVNNKIQGNYIGIGSDGTSNIGNGYNGISHSGGSGNIIGKVNAGGENVISNNGQCGILINGAGTTTISSNLIGTSADGSTGAGNTYSGIQLETTSQVLIGTEDGAKVIIADNGIDGIRVNDASQNKIQRCYIGTDVNGTSPLGNSGYGIYISNNSNFNQIGTDSDGTNDSSEGNVISANSAGIRINTVALSTTLVRGNYIGVDATGNAAMANSSIGIQVGSGKTRTLIGTDGNNVNDANEGNIISGNGTVGIRLDDSEEVFIAGNLIGIGADQTTAISNGNEGIYIAGASHDNTIGYYSGMINTNMDQIKNTIHNSQRTGITISGSGLRNRISRNSFSSNQDIAIDLNNDDVSSNDNGDGDSGANETYNFPVIENAVLLGTDLVISGFCRSSAEIEIYEADSGPTPVGHSYSESFGAGERYLTSVSEGSVQDTDSNSGTYTNDGTGAGVTRTANRFEFTIDATSLGLSGGSRIALLAIDSNGNTSEFGQVFALYTGEVCNDGIDNDGDGMIDCLEICGNGIDDNEDGRIDETYPGGVEENLILWLKADAGFGAVVWEDQSQYGNDASVSGNPSQIANGQNFNPVIDFDGNDAVYSNLPELIFDGTTNHIAIFMVYKPDNTNTGQGMFGNQHPTGFNNIYLNNGQIGTGGTTGPVVNSSYFSNGYHLISMILDEENLVEGSSSEVLEKGQNTNAFIFDEVNSTYVSDDFYIGSSGLHSSSNFFDGKIAEVLVYSNGIGGLSIDEDEREKIESYLALKYGLSLQTDYLNSQ